MVAYSSSHHLNQSQLYSYNLLQQLHSFFMAKRITLFMQNKEALLKIQCQKTLCAPFKLACSLTRASKPIPADLNLWEIADFVHIVPLIDPQAQGLPYFPP